MAQTTEELLALSKSAREKVSGGGGAGEKKADAAERKSAKKAKR